MQTTAEKLYYMVVLYWSKGKQPEIIKRFVCDNLQPMTHKECMTVIGKQMKYPGRTFTVREIT